MTKKAACFSVVRSNESADQYENLDPQLFSDSALLHLANHSYLHPSVLFNFRFMFFCLFFFNRCLAETEGHVLTVEITCTHLHLRVRNI